MKNKVLKQMLAFSLAVALVGGNSVATFKQKNVTKKVLHYGLHM